MMGNIRNRLRLEILKKDDIKNTFKGLSKIFLMEFINHMKTVIVILLNKVNFLWINQLMLIIFRSMKPAFVRDSI